jgi:tetrapyrrole methylase family protein/MazG family protein
VNPNDLTEKELGSFDTLLRILAYLRSPEGCPWDREQTHASLKRNLLEESYEVLEAIDTDKPDRLAEELGDILLQVAFHTQIARERGEFQPEDVIRSINRKLIKRHPHVFGTEKVTDAKEVIQRWEEFKGRKGDGKPLLNGIPKETPGLAYSQLMQDRAAKTGFDWENVEGVIEKVAEEVRELKAARTKEEREDELGDLLFSIVNLARWLDIHAEDALRQTNRRFLERFSAMERLCRERGLDFESLPMEQKEALWQEAKGLED